MTSFLTLMSNDVTYTAFAILGCAHRTSSKIHFLIMKKFLLIASTPNSFTINYFICTWIHSAILMPCLWADPPYCTLWNAWLSSSKAINCILSTLISMNAPPYCNFKWNSSLLQCQMTLSTTAMSNDILLGYYDDFPHFACSLYFYQFRLREE